MENNHSGLTLVVASLDKLWLQFIESIHLQDWKSAVTILSAIVESLEALKNSNEAATNQVP
ncbi:MAG: hypothetical protein ACREKE_07870 [bacterium]